MHHLHYSHFFHLLPQGTMSAFMAGVMLGAFVLGKLADRSGTVTAHIKLLFLVTAQYSSCTKLNHCTTGTSGSVVRTASVCLLPELSSSTRSPASPAPSGSMWQPRPASASSVQVNPGVLPFCLSDSVFLIVSDSLYLMVWMVSI